ncbi:hypothetical protein [Kytococcus sedentarius]|uniref:hypothetical protein n=1 Tax=Kytococcus sedentarius TaxID=1276 RepID=UPI0035BC713E
MGHPRTVGPVRFGVPAAAAYAYLSDPGARPAWQASLRRVADVAPAQRRWRDVTWVPGVSPAMTETLAEPPHRWAEAGVAGPFTAHLLLEIAEEGAAPGAAAGDAPGASAGRCWVTAHVVVEGPLGIGRVLTRLAGPAIAADLRRAARLAPEA